MIAPAAAAAKEVDVAALNGTFTGGARGWSATSSCAPLCSVTSAVDPGPGAGEPGSASVTYTTLAGLLGGLASGTSTWTSPSFTWTDATPDSAVVTYARKAAIGGLLTVGGSASAQVQLRDLTTGTVTTLASERISTAEASFGDESVAFEPSLLVQAHSYRLLLTTDLSAAALLSNIQVAYDDIDLTAAVAAPASSGSTAAIQLLAARVVRYAPGRPITLRVRATRAGDAVAGVAVTLRFGATTRRLTTDRNGYAALRLTRRARAALRITFRAGSAGATTWARPR